MTFNRAKRRLAALAALFAITLQALWPLLSHARPMDPSQLVPVCTVDGVTHYLELKAGKTTPLEERSATHGEHCKLCVFGDGKTALDVAPGLVVFLPRDKSSKVVKPVVSSRGQAPLHSAHPRAPPQSS
jgi:hypothetical protein